MKTTRSPSVTLAALLCCLASSAAAGELFEIQTSGASPGRYYLRVDVDSGGVATVTPVSHSVVSLSGKPGPTPDDPVPDPGDPTDTDLTALARGWIGTVEDYPKKSEHRVQLALMYRSILADDRFPKDQLIETIAKGTDLVLRKDAGKWKSYRKSFGQYLVDRSREGKMETREQITSVYTDVGLALDGGNALGDGRWREFFLEYIWPLLLKLLLEQLS